MHIQAEFETKVLQLQAVTAQHEQSPSGAPDEPSGKKKRKSLSRQAYKQKQRARKNPPSSQAGHQSGMTDPSQPAALPTSGTPLQQAPSGQADVSMLLGPAAASAAAVTTDPGPLAAAPAAHVTRVSGARQPTVKLSRRQKMRLSIQRQLAAAQAAAVVQQQQQQQLPPLRNKPEVDKPASVPTQSPSKVLHDLLLISKFAFTHSLNTWTLDMCFALESAKRSTHIHTCTRTRPHAVRYAGKAYSHIIGVVPD